MKKINKNLALLLSGQLVSQFGDKFYNIAITFWVFKVTNSPAIMGIVLCSQMIGSILTGLFAGGIVDSFNRKNILIIADVIRGLIVSLFAVLFYSHIFNLTLIVVVEVLLGINTAFFNTATPAALPQIVNDDELVQANSKSQFISGSSDVFGPLLAGIAIAAFGYGIAFIVNAASFFLSAFFELFIKLPHIKEKINHMQKSIKIKLIEGYKYIYNSKQIMLIIIVVTIVHLFFGSILVVMPVMAKALAQDSGAKLLGYFQTALGIGTIITAMVLSRMKIAKNEDKYMFLGFTGIGVMFCVIAGVGFMGRSFEPILLLCFVALSCSITLTWINFRVVLQKSIAGNMTGRVFGVVETICNSSIPLAALLFGFLLEYFKFYNVLITSGALLLITSFVLAKHYFSRITGVKS